MNPQRIYLEIVKELAFEGNTKKTQDGVLVEFNQPYPNKKGVRWKEVRNQADFLKIPNGTQIWISGEDPTGHKQSTIIGCFMLRKTRKEIK